MTRRTGVILALLLLAGSLAIGIPMHKWNDAHREKYDYAFPDLQDARDVGTAKKIITTWNWSGANDDIRRAVQLDLAFPLFYATLLALLAYCASLLRPTPWVARLGRIIAFMALLGGLADLGENTAILMMLGNAQAPYHAVMRVFAIVKGVALFAALAYLLFAHLDSVSAPDAIASDVLPDT